MGKQNRGKYQCIAVPTRASAPASTTATSTSTLNKKVTGMPVDPTTGKMVEPWNGRAWSANALGIKPKHETPTFEELAARFPGIQEADATQRQLFAQQQDGDADMEMDDGEQKSSLESSSPTKKPTTTLSRRTPSKSRPGTRTGTPAPSTPGSPSLGAAHSATSMTDEFNLAATPSRIPVTGATWKSPASSTLSVPRRSLAISGNRSKTLSRSWNLKKEQRQKALEARAKQLKLNEVTAEERRERARATAQKLAYKKEQENKNQMVQVITDTRKIKNMSRKQLRSIQKMDVHMINKGPSVTSQTLSRGTVPKGQ